ncbi:MAG: hypothetical protein ACC641_06345 [Acidiferrobacterales bacterium]
MTRLRQVVGQLTVYGLFVAMIGYFSASPPYVRLAPDQAIIKLSFSHSGQPVGECRERSDEELAKLAPNMRERIVCPRERYPVSVELRLDDKLVYREILQPSGLRRDSVSSAYNRFVVKAGSHLIKVQLGDRSPDSGYTSTLEQRVLLRPAQVVVIDFNGETNRFVLK